MSTIELKNDLHRMVVETNDPVVLEQVAALFNALTGGEDWWDQLSQEEKQKIDHGMSDLSNQQTSSYKIVKEKVKSVLKN